MLKRSRKRFFHLYFEIISLFASLFLSAQLLQFRTPLRLSHRTPPLFVLFRMIIELRIGSSSSCATSSRSTLQSRFTIGHERQLERRPLIFFVYKTTCWFAWWAPNNENFKINRKIQLLRLLKRCKRCFYVAVDLKFVVPCDGEYGPYLDQTPTPSTKRSNNIATCPFRIW